MSMRDHAGHRLDPQAAFAEIGRIDLRSQDLPQVLQRVTELAKATVPGVDEASISLVRGGRATTPAATGALAMDCDQVQYDAGAGPCLDAAQGGDPVLVDDVTAEQRWPGYTGPAAAVGCGSSLSLCLPVQEAVTGALNLYSRQPHVFDEDAVELARTFASYAAVAVANAQLYASTAALARQMEEAMASRAVIEQAKGMIMARRGCGPDEAFEVLVHASTRSNRKLREIAAEVVASAQRSRGWRLSGEGR